MAPIAQDYHMHSDFSYDCQVPMRQMCLAAISKNISEIGFTEHCDYLLIAPWRDRLDLAAWNEEVERCRREFEGQLQILKGLEFGEPHLLTQELARVEKLYAFDYILGSLHWVGDRSVFDKEYFKRGYIASFEDFFTELEMMTKEPRFDILSHFDVVARQGALHFPQYNVADFESSIRAVLRNCVKADIALDINTAALRQKAHLMTPNLKILRWYKEMGGQKVTLGADAHFAEDVGAHLPDAIELLQEAGFDRLCRFRNRASNWVPLTS